MRWGSPGKGKFGALVWKELRESFRWGAVVLGLTAMWAPYLVRYHSYGWWFNPIPTPDLLLPAAGFVIGLSQALRDSRGDAWGFLIHRPMRRSSLFLGKVTAGLVIYFLSTGVPLLAATVWLAMPGHMDEPYGWRLSLPLAVDLLTGLVYYFAALFAGCQPRWYGGYGLAAVIPLSVSLAISNTEALATALALNVVGLVVMVAAARATFNAAGRYEPRPAAGRSAAVLAVGLTLTGLVWGSSRGDSRGRHGVAGNPYGMTSDGTIVHYGDTVRDLQGRPVEYRADEDRSENLVELYFDLHADPPDSDSFGRGFRSNAGVFERLSGEEFGGASSRRRTWYYVYDRALIAEYDNESQNLIGWLGPGGYRRGQTPPATRFEGDLIGPRYYGDKTGHTTTGSFGNPGVLVFPGAVYKVDLVEHRVETLFRSQAEESVVAAYSNSYPDWHPKKLDDSASFDVIVTTQAIYIQTPSGSRLVTAPRDPQATGYGAVAIYRALESAETPWAIWYRQHVSDPPTQPDQVAVFNSQGVPVGHYTLPHHADPLSPSPRTAVFPIPALAAPAAIAMTNALRASPLHDVFFEVTDRPEAQQLLRLVDWGIPLLGSLASAFLMFALAWGHAFPRRRRWLWAGVGVLLGPAGLALMLLLLDWPAFETCCACGRNRIVTRVQCEHCGASFRPPEPDGSEIFELAEFRGEFSK